MKSVPERVEAFESGMRERATAGAARIIGREEAERLAADIYAEPDAQQLSPYELSVLRRTRRRSPREQDLELRIYEPQVYLPKSFIKLNIYISHQYGYHSGNHTS